MDKWFTNKWKPLYAPDDGAGGTATTETPAVVTTTETPAAATTEAAAATTEATTTETPVAAVEPVAPVIEPNSVSKRIDQLTAEKYAAIRKEQQTADNLRLAQETITQLKQATAPAGDDTTTTTAAAPQITTAQLREMARVEAENMTFNEKCNNTVMTGKAKFQDFDAAMINLRNLSPIADRNGQPLIPKTLLDAVFEAATAEGAPKADDIVYALGRDTAEADRIMQLSPIQQAVAVARFAAKVPVKQAPGTVRSAAPPPIKPAVGNGVTVTDVRADDERSIQMPIGDWMKQRQKDLEKKAAAR